jgi:hypothetical protein
VRLLASSTIHPLIRLGCLLTAGLLGFAAVSLLSTKYDHTNIV